MPDAAQSPTDANRGNQVVAFPRSLERPLHNLPLELSSFIGREQELAEVKRLLLEDKNRLLTLTGPGGCGKTRLALAVAADVVGEFEDGAWVVELASLSDPDLLPQAMAEALKVSEQPGRPLTDTLVDSLRSRWLLLVLDNCEHLIEACAVLADALLHACPEVCILATSREPLALAGERAWLVPSLLVPDPEHPLPIDEPTRYEAIQLFVERAKAIVSTFELTEQNAPAVAQVCRRLDGVPLAIELAAARVRLLSVEQIALRLEDSFGLLTGGSRTALPRHRTLRATVDWSHELLSQKERVLFRRLSVFAGGFTLGAAEAVCAGEGIEREDVLDLLSHLVDKSLVMVAEQQSGEARYRPLETVRQYGRERLEESGGAERARRRHAEYFVALAEEAEPELKGAQQVAWLDTLETEQGNLRAALSWSLAPEDAKPVERADLGLRLAAALWLFWYTHGLSEGHRWLETALESGRTESIVRAKALNGVGWIMLYRGEYEQAVTRLEDGLALFKKLGDKSGAAVSLAYLGRTVVHQGDEGRIEALREEGEALRREGLDRRAVAELLFFLGAVARHERDYERSVALCEEGLALFRELEDTRAITRCVNGLGVVALEYGDQERAAALLEEGLRPLRALRDTTGISFSLLGLAGVAGSRGEAARAARLWGQRRPCERTLASLWDTTNAPTTTTKAASPRHVSNSTRRPGKRHGRRGGRCRLSRPSSTPCPKRKSRLLPRPHRRRTRPDSPPASSRSWG